MDAKAATTSAVAQSPNTFTGIFQNRFSISSGKAKAILKYRTSQQGQQALLKSLKWLKSVQRPDVYGEKAQVIEQQ